MFQVTLCSQFKTHTNWETTAPFRSPSGGNYPDFLRAANLCCQEALAILSWRNSKVTERSSGCADGFESWIHSREKPKPTFAHCLFQLPRQMPSLLELEEIQSCTYFTNKSEESVTKWKTLPSCIKTMNKIWSKNLAHQTLFPPKAW